MTLKIVFVTVLLNLEFSFEKINQNIFDIFLDYDSNFETEKNNLRQKFLIKKKQKQDQDLKIKLFDHINSDKTLFVDGILHSFVGLDLKNEMETAFRNLLTMNGSKLIYKRGFFWRTWRVVQNEFGISSVICYKCQSLINETDGKCCSGGYWAIEEIPPKCPYEILTLKTDQELCIINNAQYYKPFDICPSVITMRDLRISCGDSIETIWRITKTYDVPERSTTVICQGRENCDVSTLYSFVNDSIVFRMINSTNNVFYSRAMKSGNKNYICINDCGIFDPVTKEIRKSEGPLTYDLFKSIKNKRDLKKKKKIDQIKKATTKNIPQSINQIKLLNNGLHYKEKVQNGGNMQNDISPTSKTIKVKIKSPCMKLQEKYLKEYDDSSDYYD